MALTLTIAVSTTIGVAFAALRLYRMRSRLERDRQICQRLIEWNYQAEN
jgi:hypothetical protein